MVKLIIDFTEKNFFVEKLISRKNIKIFYFLGTFQFIPGVVTSKQFVAGQFIGENNDINFVHGEVVHTKTGSKFVEGETVLTPDGLKFVAGKKVK